MAGKLFALARLGKEAMHIVSVGCRERVLDAPDFLQHQVGALVRLQLFCRVIQIGLGCPLLHVEPEGFQCRRAWDDKR